MFKFLKDKLKNAVSKFTTAVSKDVEEEIIDEPVEEIEDIENFENIKEDIRENKKPQKKKSKLKKDVDISDEDVEKFLDENIKENIESDVKKSDSEFVQDDSKILEDIENYAEKSEAKKDDSSILAEENEILDDIDQNVKDEFVNEEVKEKVEEKKKGFFGRLKDKFTKKDEEFEISKEIEEDVEKSLENAEKESKSEIERSEDKEFVIDESQDIFSEHDKAVMEDLKRVEKEIEAEKEVYVEEDSEDEEEVEEIKAEVEEKAEKKGFFGRLKESITHKALSDEKFNDLFWELELVLLESNVALEVIEKIKDDLKKELVDSKIARIGVDKIVANTLKKSIEELFDIEKVDLIGRINDRKKENVKENKKDPFVISFVGINGAGKTTTLAKIANYLQKNDFSVVFAAADTFRAASMEQLQFHADKLGIKMIKHDYGSDPAAVAFDAIAHAKSKGIDVVLIDTAGRTNMDSNLMEELRKIIKVAKPDLNIFIGDAVTGNDAVEQAQKFNEYVGIDGIVLAKADVDEKGGCSVSISYVTKKPILFIGVGQTYDDLKEFDSSIVLENLGLA